MIVTGFLYLLLVFAISFAVIHLIKLAIIGFLSVRAKKCAPQKPKPKRRAKKPQEVYYVVTKKNADGK